MNEEKIEYDEYHIPTVDSLQFLKPGEFTESDERLEKVLQRKITSTEKSASESMDTEHASYGSSRFYLKTILPTSGPNHIHAIGDEAASAAFFVTPKGKLITLSYSSESHNWPSYVCAHPGAATGTGGNERDNTANDGKRVDAVYEARRQCHPRWNPMKDPVRQHTDETTRGIADYANAMGIPHGDGSIKYHTGFTGNNLVNVMAVSVEEMERLLTNKIPAGDDDINDYVGIYIGKASDTTGIGGTKGASQAIDMTMTDLNEKAVQDPDPHLQEAETRGIEMVVDRAMEEGWKIRFSKKDMGAAGLLCSTSEQLHKNFGVIINGDMIPQNEPRTSTELLEAETQERFFIYIHKDHAQEVLDIYNEKIGLPYINKGACARVVARCNSTGRYVFVRNNVVDVDMPYEDLVSGPLLFKHVKEPIREKQGIPEHVHLKTAIDSVLGSINFKNDAYIHDHYDKHVRSTNIVNRGEGCATLRTHPLFEGRVAYSVSFDSNAVIGMLDPKLQAEDSFVRGAYKMATVGCSVVGVTNNANYGRTSIPEEMWEFAKGQEGVAKACYNWQLEDEYIDMITKNEEIAKKFEADNRRHVTVNSGNCSLNKANANTNTAIPPTAVLGLVGWTNVSNNYATWDMKDIDASLYMIGARQPALGATDYLQSAFGPDTLGDRPFKIDYKTSRKEVNAIIRAVRSGYVSAANVIEEGGLCNAVSEMMANAKKQISTKVYLGANMGSKSLDNYHKLFSESMGVVLQVGKDMEDEFNSLCNSLDATAYWIGSTVADGKAKNTDGSLRFIDREKFSYSQGMIKQLYDTKIEAMLNYEGGQP
ncbi:MAG: AIR synthase-related protein [Candidatus Aenigmarchaeota archaeon]|nr:AIR synthase-related protein [Candidatus Aenigmarchaeota archaeon]